MNIAIVGSTGNVGRKLIEVLEKKNFPVTKAFLVASSKSSGKKINFLGKEHTVENLEKFDFSKVKIAFFAAGSSVAERWAPIAAKKTIVIDNSKFFRKDPDIPLIVPEVNSEKLSNFKNKNIIANANCSVIPIVVALKPLHDLYDIKRIVASTYQSVSGAGKAGMDELISQTKEILENKKVVSKNFTKQIAFNAIPHIDSFLENGSTKEEQKNHDEIKKIMDSKIKVTSTCVRIPVLVSHSISVNVEFNKKYNLDEIKKVLSSAPGCKVIDEQKDGGYITPVDAENKFETFISRIRQDTSQDNTINMWIVSDNLLKGAALNAVEIAETLIKNDFYGK
ncbi:aspartate-semialdehyde dehydrogenase [Candidatus Pelagibacter sp.]|jgi:aspartate-semialdehyde dehydrogenase|nr:aspartate-semialdehyde dehydrogenase [Candidatus Pelagibacter sp.]|tara:strand:- start:565 stop:1575 length:1011 start_codon:yes stop_codon:yes gene_type:complete